MQPRLIPVILIAALLSVCGWASECRSTAQKNAFKAAHPCPSNGARRGPCPGYVVDHVRPLACGGADAPSNMQWQTVAEAKAKDRWERKGCQRPTASGTPSRKD